MVKLARCPFCGSLAGYSRVPGQGFSVVCRGCGAIAMHGQATERDAMALEWNRRASPAAFAGGPLLPCPFCGGAMPAAGAVVGDGTILRCPHCLLMITFARSGALETSVAQWNNRTGRRS